MSVENASKWEGPPPLWWSQSCSNLILQQRGQNKSIASRLSSARRQDNLGETFYGISLEEKCLSLSWKNIWLTLKIKAFMRSMSRSFHSSLSPRFRGTKNSALHCNTTMPSCQATDLLWWIATETDVNKIINPITLLNTGSGLEREQKKLLFRLKEIIWNGEWWDFSQSKLSWVRL